MRAVIITDEGEPFFEWCSMKAPSDTPDSQVCQARSGQFIAFWRGQLVHKLDDTLRYFATEQAAWSFLARRDSVGDSMVGAGARRRTGRKKLVIRD
jgi:hypothetical protein